MIKIITVYDSVNPGSYLQATALYSILKKNNHEVSFLYSGFRNMITEIIKKTLRMIKRKKYKYIIPQIKMSFLYKDKLKKYKVSKSINDDDIYILGSDEIWNVARKEMNKYPIFWGFNLNQKRCISYAPSINNATIDDLKRYEYVEKSIKKIPIISVRDSYSKNIIAKLTKKNIHEVCDPTVFYTKNYYKKIEENVEYKDYIFVYIDDNKLSKEEINKVREFAKKNNKKLISYSLDTPWVDKVVCGSPFVFLGLISNADYVFTGTFHGTMFSAIYNKKMIVFSKNNRKVDELLEKLNLDVKYDSNKRIEDIINNGYNVEKLNNILESMGNNGKNYLFDSIKKISLEEGI